MISLYKINKNKKYKTNNKKYFKPLFNNKKCKFIKTINTYKNKIIIQSKHKSSNKQQLKFIINNNSSNNMLYNKQDHKYTNNKISHNLF